jgi:tetratricopeptide (TPR) repeat protein
VLEEDLVDRPEQETSVRDLIRFRSGLAGILAGRGDLNQALSVAEAALDLAQDSPLATDEERARVRARLARLCASAQRTEDAADHWQAAAELYAREVQRHPKRAVAVEALRAAYTGACEQLYALGQCEAAAGAGRRALEVAHSLPPTYPDRDAYVVDSHTRIAAAAIKAQHFEEYRELESGLQRARELAASRSTAYSRVGRAKADYLHATLCEDLGTPVSAAAWEDIAVGARQFAPDFAIGADVGAARRHREDGNLEAAARALDRARGVSGSGWHVFVTEAIRLALASGDARAAVAEADRGLAADATWPTELAVASGLSATVRMLRALPMPAAPVDIGALTERSADLWRALIPKVQAAPPTGVPPRLRDLFLAQAQVHLVSLSADDADPTSLADTLRALDTKRGKVEVSKWDEAVWVEGHTIWIRQTVRRGGLQFAFEALAKWTPQLGSADHVVTAAGLHAELAQAARAHGSAEVLAAQATDGAFATLARAIQLGGMPKAVLRGDARLASLRADPRFAAALASARD